MAGEFKRLKVELLPADLSEKPAAVVYDDGLVSPFAEPRIDSELSILLVGSSGTGKRTFTSVLRRAATTKSLRIYTTSSLPLPLDGAQHARAFDFLVLLVNMTDSHSLQVARDALHHVRQETLFGHCAVLCTHVDRTSAYAVLPENLDSLALAYQLPVFYANLLRGAPEQSALRILKLAGLGAGVFAHDGATPSSVSASEPLLVTPTHL